MRATLSRRAWLQRASRMAAAFPLVWPSSGPLAFLQNSQRALNALPPPGAELAQLFENDPTKYRFTRAENAFLEELQQISCKFFWNETNPATGLVKDRSRAEGSDQRNAASIAATGFGLTALCIADQREWEDKTRARNLVRATLRFVARHVPHERGFFSPFLNIQTRGRGFQSAVFSLVPLFFFWCVL